MGKAQEMVRHGCGRIVPANGLCGPCLQRERAASAAVITDNAGHPWGLDVQRDDWLRGNTLLGAPRTSVACAAWVRLPFRVLAETVVHGLWVRASDGWAHCSIADLRVGTRSLVQGRVPLTGAVTRWEFEHLSDFHLLRPGVDVSLEVQNHSAQTVIFDAGLMGSFALE